MVAGQVKILSVVAHLIPGSLGLVPEILAVVAQILHGLLEAVNFLADALVQFIGEQLERPFVLQARNHFGAVCLNLDGEQMLFFRRANQTLGLHLKIQGFPLFPGFRKRFGKFL